MNTSLTSDLTLSMNDLLRFASWLNELGDGVGSQVREALCPLDGELDPNAVTAAALRMALDHLNADADLFECEELVERLREQLLGAMSSLS